MRRSRLGALGALGAVLLIAVTAGVAPAAVSPSATAAQALVSGSPSAIACGGSVDARVTLTAQAGSTGADTNVMLVLDLSGSTGTPASKLADLRRAALDTIDALDAADGTVNQAIAGNRAGIVVYQGSTGTVTVPLGASYSVLAAAINAPLVTAGGSPHAAGINAAAAALSAGSLARAMVLISDGQAAGAELTSATTAAGTAKSGGARIVTVGIGTGTDVSPANLQIWASPGAYQSGTPGPLDRSKLVTDLGATVAVPTTFTVTQTLGANFSAAPVSSPAGTTVTTGAGTLQWTGSLTGNQTATLVYRATRNGSNVFTATNEVVSTMSLAVAGGTATVTPPAAISIDVLPCGATPISTTTCTGAACSTSGTTPSGVQYSLSAGTPPAGTKLSMFALNASPPAGACPGFVAHTSGAEYDIRPLATDATFRMVIPRAALGATRWFQTDVCLGTNMRFTTAITSLSNLSPQATFVPGGTLPGRWWGLLPSLPRLVLIPGPRLRVRAVDHEPRPGCGRQCRNHVPRPVHHELDGLHDRRPGRVRPETLGLDRSPRW